MQESIIKYSEVKNPEQKKLREAKKVWNKQTSEFIHSLIEFKKLMNGRESDFFKSKGKITEPIPVEPSVIIQNLSSRFEDVLNKANTIGDAQKNYSSRRKEASNKLTRFLSYTKRPFFGSGEEVSSNRTRKALLSMCASLNSNLKDVNSLILDRSEVSIKKANAAFTRTINDFRMFSSFVETLVPKQLSPIKDEEENKNNHEVKRTQISPERYVITNEYTTLNKQLLALNEVLTDRIPDDVRNSKHIMYNSIIQLIPEVSEILEKTKKLDFKANDDQYEQKRILVNSLMEKVHSIKECIQVLAPDTVPKNEIRLDSDLQFLIERLASSYRKSPGRKPGSGKRSKQETETETAETILAPKTQTQIKQETEDKKQELQKVHKELINSAKELHELIFSILNRDYVEEDDLSKIYGLITTESAKIKIKNTTNPIIKSIVPLSTFLGSISPMNVNITNLNDLKFNDDGTVISDGYLSIDSILQEVKTSLNYCNLAKNTIEKLKDENRLEENFTPTFKLNQSTNQTTSESTKQTTSQPVNQPANESEFSNNEFDKILDIYKKLFYSINLLFNSFLNMRTDVALFSKDIDKSNIQNVRKSIILIVQASEQKILPELQRIKNKAQEADKKYIETLENIIQSLNEIKRLASLNQIDNINNIINNLNEKIKTNEDPIVTVTKFSLNLPEILINEKFKKDKDDFYEKFNSLKESFTNDNSLNQWQDYDVKQLLNFLNNQKRTEIFKLLNFISYLIQIHKKSKENETVKNKTLAYIKQGQDILLDLLVNLSKVLKSDSNIENIEKQFNFSIKEIKNLKKDLSLPSNDKNKIENAAKNAINFITALSSINHETPISKEGEENKSYEIYKQSNKLFDWAKTKLHEITFWNKTSPLRLKISSLIKEIRRILNEVMNSLENSINIEIIVGFKELAVEKLLQIKDLIGSLSIGSEAISSDIEDILKEKYNRRVELDDKELKNLSLRDRARRSNKLLGGI